MRGKIRNKTWLKGGMFLFFWRSALLSCSYWIVKVMVAKKDLEANIYKVRVNTIENPD